MAAVRSVADALERIRGPATTITTYGPERDEALHAFLERFDVEVYHEQLPVSADAGYLTVRSGGEDRGSVPASAFADSVDPPRDAPWTPEVRESGYGELGTLLAGARFTSLERPHLLATSREIEDRAFRVGSGAIHSGFQTVSTLRTELPVYERLGSTAVDVHVYATPDEMPPDLDDISLHLERAAEIAQSWFVVFDGGDEGSACALLAEEREPDEFYGFWTYERSTVDWILDHLESTYGPLAP